MKAARPLAQVANPIVIAALGASYTCATGKQHDYQSAVQILNQREQSELLARSAVFDKPMNAVMDKRNGIDARILALETFLYNFHGVVNARNLLTDLENEIETSHPPDPERSKKLQLIAEGVRHVQKQMLAAAMPHPISVNCGEKQTSDPLYGFPWILRVPVKEEKDKECIIGYPGRLVDTHTIGVRSLCVGKHKELESDCPNFSPLICVFSTSARIKMRVDEREFEPFELTKFGSPFSDNTIIDHGHRIALLLRSVSADSVELEVVAFPEDLVPPGYQPTITNISRLLSGESAKGLN